VKFHFSKFRDQTYYKDFEDQECKTITDLDAILYGTPIDDTKGNLENEDGIIEDPKKE
jgi:hypothetical protein